MNHSQTTPLRSRSVFSAFRVLSALKDPEAFFISGQKKFGDPYCEWLPGMGELYITGHPEGAREIFSSPRETFQEFKSTILRPLLGDHSLLVIAGENHKREKKLMMPPFHGKRLQTYGNVMQEVTLEQIQKWREIQTFPARPDLRAVTLEVIIRAMFGIKDSSQHANWRQAMSSYLDDYTPLLTVFPVLRRKVYSPWRRFVHSRETLDKMILDEIAVSLREGPETRDDILSLLLLSRDQDNVGMTPEEVKDELRTLLVGGHETSAAGLAWAVYFIHRDPKIYHKVMTELASLGATSVPAPEDLIELPYLGAICSEALRIHPIVPIVIRHLARDITLRGHRIPAGKHVAVSLVLLHRNPEVWKDPELFNPDRFIERTYSSHEYAPFGGGARRCLGAAFATYEMKIILGTILSQVRLELLNSKLVRPMLNNISMGPMGDILMRVL